MKTYTTYMSPLGRILLEADEGGLSGLWFESAKYCTVQADADLPLGFSPYLDDAKRWLDIYFRGIAPDFTPHLHLTGSPFRKEVWAALLRIPYGQTTTYGTIAKELAAVHPGRNVSAQAVGGAVGHNPVSLIVPCHRVLGADGSLTGYAGGLDRKDALLKGECVRTNQ